MGRLDDKVLLVIGGGSDGPRATASGCRSATAGPPRWPLPRRAPPSWSPTCAPTPPGDGRGDQGRGGRAGAVACDVADPEQCAAAVAAAAEAFGALHLLVNNVGIADAGGVTDTDADTFDRIMRVNVRGHLLTVRHAPARDGRGRAAGPW